MSGTDSRHPGIAAPLMRRLAGILPPVLLVGALLVAWELYARLSGIDVTTLPGPVRVAEQAWINRGLLVQNAIPTLRATLLGFAWSLTLAFALSVLVDFFAPLRRALLPVMIISQTLPLVAIAPLVVLWFGFGLAPKILLVGLVTFFPLLVGLVQGYAATDRETEWLLQSMGGGRWQVFRLLRLPTAIPFFFAGLRIGITYAVVGAIFAEYAGAEHGLGILMLNAKNNFRTDLVLAAVGISAALTLTLFGLTALIQRVSTPWARAEEASSP